MDSVRESEKNQTVVYWAFTGNYDGVGSPITSDTPVELPVRREEYEAEQLSEATNPTAKPITLFTDRLLAIGSLVWLGELSDLPEDETLVEEEFYRVVDNSTVPDLRARYAEYTAVLVRDNAPTD